MTCVYCAPKSRMTICSFIEREVFYGAGADWREKSAFGRGYASTTMQPSVRRMAHRYIYERPEWTDGSPDRRVGRTGCLHGRRAGRSGNEPGAGRLPGCGVGATAPGDCKEGAEGRRVGARFA